MRIRFTVILLFTLAVGVQRILSASQYPIQHLPILNDAYTCTVFANYNLQGETVHHFKPVKNFCQDAFRTGSCEACCRMSAILEGTTATENKIIGFNVVLKREPLCICCAPTTA